jgi:hypothetical protein
LIVALSLSSGLLAQEAGKPASIALELTDQSGAVVPKARVLIVPLPNAFEGMLITGSDGRLSLDLPPGSYSLRVQMLGFDPVKRPIEAKPGGHQTISIQLIAGSCTDCLAVGSASEPPPLSFPERSFVFSPDGRYRLTRKGWPSAGSHTVELEDRVLKTRRELFQYGRRVVFHWWGKLIIATDYVGDQDARCTLYSVDRHTPPIQVLDLLFSQLDEDERIGLKDYLSKRRLRVEALEWDPWYLWGGGLAARGKSRLN